MTARGATVFCDPLFLLEALLASLHLSISNPSGEISQSGLRGFKIYVKGPQFIELMLLSRTVAVQQCGDLDFTAM